jgi:hypothetical protein
LANFLAPMLFAVLGHDLGIAARASQTFLPNFASHDPRCGALRPS